MPVDITIDDGIAQVTLRRPEALNALDLEMLRQLSDVWQQVDQDPSVAVVLLSGHGGNFSAGADLKSVLPLITAGGLEDEVVGPTNGAFAKFVLSKPVVAAVEGVCIAGGTELLQVADIRIAGRTARFGLAEPKWGLFPAGGSTVRLARQIPFCHAMEVLLTGSQFSAVQALEMGLVNRVVDDGDVMTTARELAATIAGNGALAVQAIKRSVLESWGQPLAAAFEVESALAREVFQSNDAVEGPSAFREKRDPRFTGS